MPANMTQETLKKQVREEAVKKFKASIIKEMKKAVLSAYKPQGLGENSNTNSMVRDQTACGGMCKKPPPANILDMKELSTLLDNCHMVDCASCGGTSMKL
ncbi:hypothetical protein C2S51_034767 [Perilla frutescens var. frutescens]|nr:hypothetical protein C2S51_034767 [Perilla frutescens var. frutescens]